MKRILLTLPILFVFLFSMCSDNESKDDPITITLSKNEINIPVDDEADIEVTGVLLDDCLVSSDDEFIATASVYNGKVSIDANHTGATKIIVEYKDNKAECIVNVTSLINYIGNPIIELGVSKEEIKSKLKGEIIEETNDRIEIKEDFEYPIYDTYHFKNGKLECVFSSVNVGTNIINISNSLLERYEYLSSESKAHWYSYPNKFIVREEEQGGNGGFHIVYAKDKDTMRRYYQMD